MSELLFKSKFDKADQTLSEIYAGENLKGFRDDVEEIWAENREGKLWEVNSEKVAADIMNSSNRLRQQVLSIEDGITKLQLLDGLTGGILAFILYSIFIYIGVSWFPSFLASILVFVFFTLLNHGVLYTKVIMNRVCYQKASPREEDSRLLFKRSWNSKVLSSNSSIIGILVVSLTRRLWRSAYEVGLDVLKFLDKRRYC